MKIEKFIATTLFTAVFILFTAIQVFGQRNEIFEKSAKAPQFEFPRSGPLLFNQMTNPGTGYIISHHFSTAANVTETSAAADDFDVPEGETWDIWSVGIVGSYFQNNPGGGDTLNIFFMADNDGKPGDTIQEFWAYTGFQQQIDTIDQWIRTYFDITLPGAVTLETGTYWLSVQMYSDFNVTGKWGWMENVYSSAINGAEWHWINPLDGWGMGCTDWTPASVVVGPWLTWELAFALYGQPHENDLSVKTILSPDSYYYGMPTDPIDVTAIIKNEGLNPQTGFDVKYMMNGVEVVENIGPVTLGYNETYEYTFSQQVDLSIPGNYELAVSTLLPGDEYPENDTKVLNIFVFDPTIYTMPSEETSSITACSGTFTDAAGLEGDLIVSDWGVLTLYPSTPGTKMRLKFIEFDIGWSDFWIYDGEDDNAPLLGFWEDTLNPGTLTASYQNTTGALTVKFEAQSWTPFEKPGWSANITCHEEVEDDFEVMKVESGYPAVFAKDYVPLYAYVKNVGTEILDKEVTFTVNGDTIAVVPTGLVTQSDTVVVQATWHPTTSGDYVIVASVPEDQGGDDNNSATLSKYVYPFDFFYEGFEAESFPPDGWSQSSTFWVRKDAWPAVGEAHAFCDAPYGMFDTLYTPLLHITDTAKLNFMAFSSAWWPGELDLVWINAETGESQLIESINLPFIWYSSFEIDVSVAEGNNYLGFVGRYNPGGGDGEVKVDEVVGDGIFRFYNQNDLKAYILSGNNTPEVNAPTTFEIDIKNVGSEFQSGSEYTLKLMKEGGVELMSYPGQDIDGKEVIHFTLDYTFENTGLNVCYVEIDFPEDQDLSNNASTPLDVYVQQEGTEQIQIGDGNDFESNWFHPITTYSPAYYTQTLYLAEDLGEPNTITGIMYYYFCEDNYPIEDIPVEMWFSETTETDMSGGLEAANDYTKVFDGTVTFQPGIHGVYIPLDYVYSYSGDNLIVTTYKENNTPFLGFSRMGVTHVADTMVRYYNGYNYPIDPYDQTSLDNAYQFHKTEFANTKFFKIDLNGQYCLPQTIYGTENGDYINSVEFNEIENLNTGSQGGPAYTNYTNLSANVERGRTYLLTVQAETSGEEGSIAAWIDFNGNNNFDDEGERIVHIRSNDASQEISVLVTIPDDAALGLTLMRVRNSADPDLFASCEAVTYGETEDYSINIIETIQVYSPVPSFEASLLDEGNVDLQWSVPENPGMATTEGFEMNIWPPAEGWEIKQSTTLNGNLNDPAGSTWLQYGEDWDFVYDGEFSALCPDTAMDFNWLITPEILLYGNDEISFMLHYTSDPNGYSKFYVRAFADGEWNTVLEYTDEITMSNHFDEPVSVDLNPFAGKTVRIAFVTQYNDAYPVALDDIVIKGTTAPGKEVAGLTGYQIYKNDVLLTEINDPSVVEFSDTVTQTENYHYCINAVYADEGISEALCDEIFYLVPLTPPVNVVASTDSNHVLVQWTAPDGGIIRFADQFDDYTAGGQVACQNPDDWTTWTMEPCAVNDPYVSDEMAYSGDNSVDITEEADLLYLTDELLTIGKYSLNFRMYIPAGYNGYFNVLQEHNLSTGSHWGIQAFFDENGIGLIDAGGTGSASFFYDYDEWMYIDVEVNLDQDTAFFFIDGNLIHGWKWSTGINGLGNTNSLEGCDFYAWNTNNTCKYYMDDFQLIQRYDPSVTLNYNISRDGEFLANTSETDFLDTSVEPGYHTYCVAAVYTEGESEAVCDFVTLYSAPENFAAELQNENDVYCTWDEITGAVDGYYVYRDGVKASDLLTTNEWTDLNVTGGTHEYYVTAAYTGGESMPSNAVTLVILITPKNLVANADGEGNIVLNWDPVGEVITGQLVELFQHDGTPDNGLYEWFDFGYGVVFDLSAYPGATIEMADFFHESWGLSGTWTYIFHIIDWENLVEIGYAGPFQTTGDDQWEVEIPLGSLSPTSTQIGIFLEPMSNDPEDAYPVISIDDGQEGNSLQVSLNDYTQNSPAGGDFLLDLWIWNPITKQMVKAKKVKIDNAGLSNVRNPYKPVKGRFTIDQHDNNKGSRVLTGYNVYHALESNAFEMIGNTIDTTFVHAGAGWVPGAHYYYVTAQYEEGESNPSDTAVEVISGISEEAFNKLSVYPNPAHDVVQINAAEEIQSILMINATGRVVLHQKDIFSKTCRINLRGLHPGIYNVRIETAEGWTSRKIIKM